MTIIYKLCCAINICNDYEDSTEEQRHTVHVSVDMLFQKQVSL